MPSRWNGPQRREMQRAVSGVDQGRRLQSIDLAFSQIAGLLMPSSRAFDTRGKLVMLRRCGSTKRLYGYCLAVLMHATVGRERTKLRRKATTGLGGAVRQACCEY
jgi:hypothetical protein